MGSPGLDILCPSMAVTRGDRVTPRCPSTLRAQGWLCWVGARERRMDIFTLTLEPKDGKGSPG